MITFEDWGTIAYPDAWKKQQVFFDEALNRKKQHLPVQNKIIFCEHPHVITLGRFATEKHVLISEKSLQQKNILLFHTDRGGDVTYHGPGQLVVYLILDLSAFSLGLKQYIFLLEEAIISLLHEKYSVTASRLPQATGVWLDVDRHPSLTRKICAIGVKSSQYITMHGLALNINTDLSYFSLINPCGFTDKGVTSIARELNNEEQNISHCKEYLKERFSAVFSNKTK